MKKPKEANNFKKIAKIICIILGIIYIIIGFIFIVNSLRSITGLAVIDKITPPASTLFGIFFIASGIGHIYLAKVKKGQAAMEFLLTYGWAVFSAIIVFSVVTYYFVFASVDLANRPPILSAPFYAVAAGFDSGTNTFSLDVKTTAQPLQT